MKYCVAIDGSENSKTAFYAAMRMHKSGDDLVVICVLKAEKKKTPKVPGCSSVFYMKSSFRTRFSKEKWGLTT